MKKTVKRFISLLAVFALACTMLTAVYADGPQFEVIIDSASSVVEPGDTFAVTVKLNNLNTVRAGDIFLKYNKDAFSVSGTPEIDSGFKGLFSAAEPQLGANTEGLVKLAFASGLPLNISETQVMFTAQFTAKTEFGIHDFSMDAASKLYVGENNEPERVDFDVSGATVTITSDSDATLSELAVSAGTLNFNPGVTSYDLGEVSNNVSQLVISAKANNPGAKITYNGAASNAVSLDVGENTIKVLVTAVDGTTTKEYTITVTRKDRTTTGGGSIGNTITGPKKDDPTKPDDGKDNPTNPDDKKRPSDKFTDLTGYDWALDHIDKLIEKEIVNGTSETTYEPGADVTRAQFAKLVALAFGLEKTDAAATVYSDVNDGDWFKEYVDIASQNGIVSGYPDGTFLPNAKITREEMCVMLARALKSYELETKKNTFADRAQMGDWAIESIDLLSANGVIVGKENNLFAPKDYATRAESAVVISRVLEIISK